MNGLEFVLLLENDEGGLQRGTLFWTEDDAAEGEQVQIETKIFCFDAHLSKDRMNFPFR